MSLGKSMSIANFKKLHNTEDLECYTNPKTGKPAVSVGGKTVAAISKKWDKKLESEFIEIIDDETGASLWCLHNKNTTNHIATL